MTKYQLYTQAYDLAWFQLSQYPAAQIPELLAALVEYQEAAEDESKAGLIFSPTPNVTTIGLLYAEPVEKPDIFQRFLSIPAQEVFLAATNSTQSDISTSFSSPTEGPTK